jgi:hypothetical protein
MGVADPGSKPGSHIKKSPLLERKVLAPHVRVSSHTLFSGDFSLPGEFLSINITAFLFYLI